jgi:hypothetical protein
MNLTDYFYGTKFSVQQQILLRTQRTASGTINHTKNTGLFFWLFSVDSAAIVLQVLMVIYFKPIAPFSQFALIE